MVDRLFTLTLWPWDTLASRTSSLDNWSVPWFNSMGSLEPLSTTWTSHSLASFGAISSNYQEQLSSWEGPTTHKLMVRLRWWTRVWKRTCDDFAVRNWESGSNGFFGWSIVIILPFTPVSILPPLMLFMEYLHPHHWHTFWGWPVCKRWRTS